MVTPPREPTQRITIQIPWTMYQRLKQEESITAYIIEAVREKLGKEEKK